MKRRLSNTQRQAVKKTLFLILALAVFLSALAAIPYLASLIPRFSATATRTLLKDAKITPQSVPTFAFGSGEEPEKTNDGIENLDQSVAPSQTEPDPETPPPPQRQEGDLPVFSDNLCWYDADEAPTLDLINRTKYDIDLDDYLTRDFPVSAKITDSPLVLIVHTHGSESFLPDRQDFYSPDEDFRSLTEEETVVGIGDTLCERLNQLGIPTIQDKTMHDIPDYNSAYVSSADAIKKILAENPTIKFVIDLHRDSVFDANGNNVKPVTDINGKDCAQLMLVVGTDQMGIAHPNWRDNLTFATYLQKEMNDTYPTLARPVNLRIQEFNQSYTKGSLILEVGSCGNTLQEAENAVTLFAECYAELLKTQLAN